MHYKSDKIESFLDGMSKNSFLLPAIQRGYVWKERQIVRFIDSLMRDFPTGTLLLWNKPSGEMYKFNQHYSKEIGNKKASSGEVHDSTDGVLDGQQRLTSIFIAFRGTYNGKRLYFNIGYFDSDAEEWYEFAFLDDVTARTDEKKWVAVEDICACKISPSNKVCGKFGATNDIERSNIKRLYSMYKTTELSYYEFENDKLSDVLEIFVRVNSGGTTLSKTAFLFSSLINSWNGGKKCIETLIKTARSILKDDSRIDTDFVIRSAMYLEGYGTKVKIKDLNSSSEKLKALKDDWILISVSIILAMKLIRSWGFRKQSIVSFSAILPVAYYLYNKYNGKERETQIPKDDKDMLKKMFILSQLNKLFNSAVDARLASVKAALDKKNSWSELKKAYPKVFAVKAKDGGKWIDSYSYQNKSYCYLILSLLNPGTRGDIDFHIDHLHPKSFFIDSKDGLSMAAGLKKMKMKESDKKRWMDLCNKLPNLGLLNGDANHMKNDTSLEDWLEKFDDYRDNFIAKNWNLSINDFENFYMKRRDKLISRIKDVLK